MKKNTVQPNGHKIRRLRHVRNMTQSDLAEAAVLGKRTVEKIEASNPAYPDTLRDIARVLNVDYEELLAPDELEMIRGIDALKELMEALREEIRFILGNYEKEFKLGLDQGQSTADVKRRLMEMSRSRIDHRAKCSQVARDVKLGLRHRSPQDWDIFFRDTQRLFANFQENVHTCVVSQNTSDLKDWSEYQEQIIGRIKAELNECINQLI